MTERFYGLLPTVPDPRDFRLEPPRAYTGKFVNLSGGIVRVYDQGQLGSCVSNGTAAAVDYVTAKQAGDPYGPSRLFIYYQGRKRAGYPLNQDTGLQIRDGINAVALDGAPPETDWTYNIDRFADQPPAKAYADGQERQALKYAAVEPGQLDDAIASGYPVVSGFDVPASFESNEVADSGVLPLPEDGEEILGGHCTIYLSTVQEGSHIQGGKPGVYYRLKLNSWGTRWGLDGLYWEPVEFAEKYESDFWIITSVEDPAVTPPPPPPPGDPDRALAAVLGPWAVKRHTGATRPVADASRAWLKAKGL